jgi:hypothetical protein
MPAEGAVVGVVRAGACRRLLAAVAVVGLSMLPSASGRADATARHGCEPATIAGQSHVDPATGAFLGTGILGLGGSQIAIDWVSTIATIVENPDGSLALTGSHHIVSSGNASVDFTTTDTVSAIPTEIPGRYVFTSVLLVDGGRGRVKSGRLDVTGRVDLIAGDVILDGSSGTLCAAPAP